MTAKNVQLKKRLIKEAVIAVVLLIAIGAGAAELSNFDDEAQTEKQQKESENAALRTKIDGLQAQLDSGADVVAYYDSYIKNHSGDFLLNREAVTGMLADLREKHHLVNLGVTIAPVSDVTDTPIGLKSGKLVKSEIHLTFGALTDNSAYGFIEALQRQLPGIVYISEVKLTRTADLSRNVLIDLSQHRITPLVAGEMTFLWLGIHPNADEKSEPGSLPSGSAAGGKHG